MVPDDHPDTIAGIPFEQIREIIEAKLDVDEYVTDVDEPADLLIVTHEELYRVASSLEPLFIVITDPRRTLDTAGESQIALKVNPSKF